MVRGERDGQRGGPMWQRRVSAAGMKHRSRAVLFTVAMAIVGNSLAAAELTGDEPLAVRDAIGGGIHAYHAGDFDRAYDDLTNAIEAGTDDPRSYYFRGLAALRLGRTSEAEADFTTGADRELSTGSMRRVSQSLERVQGHDRLAIERFRARARLGTLQRERDAYGRRYSTIEDASGDVRRRRRPEDIRPELVAPRGRSTGELPPADRDVEEVPAPKGKPAKPFEDEPAAEPEEDAPESDDPFGDEPAPRKRMSEDKAAQKDVQSEELSAEVEDTAAERDVQNEVEAAAGQ